MMWIATMVLDSTNWYVDCIEWILDFTNWYVDCMEWILNSFN